MKYYTTQFIIALITKIIDMTVPQMQDLGVTSVEFQGCTSGFGMFWHWIGGLSSCV